VIERFLKRRDSFAQTILGIRPRTHIDRASGIADALPYDIRPAVAVVVRDVRAQELFARELEAEQLARRVAILEQKIADIERSGRN
jgi:hypothetical protein